jgi:hypothetical protein
MKNSEIKSLIEKYKLNKITETKWENDNYILEIRPNDLTIQATAVKCLVYFPNKYPKLKKEIKKIGKIPIEITLTEDYTLIETDVKKYKQYVELILNTDI